MPSPARAAGRGRVCRAYGKPAIELFRQPLRLFGAQHAHSPVVAAQRFVDTRSGFGEQALQFLAREPAEYGDARCRRLFAGQGEVPQCGLDVYVWPVP